MRTKRQALLDRLRAANPIPEPEQDQPLNRRAEDLLDRVVERPAATPLGRRWYESPRMRAGALAAALLAGAAVGAGATVAGTTGGSPPGPDPAALSRVSTRGTPVEVTGPHRFREARLMAVRADTAFLRFPASGCFGISFVPPPRRPYRPGIIDCTKRFPSRELPIADQSPVDVTTGHERFLRIEGFAADGVARVGVEDATGTVVAETAVRDNVYKITAFPPGRIAAFVAWDEHGNVVYRR